MGHHKNGQAPPVQPEPRAPSARLRGHALRNANLRLRSLARAEEAPPLARALVQVRADALQMTRLEFARRSGIGRGTLRDVELGIHTPTRRTLQRFLGYCQRCRVGPGRLEELRRLYAGLPETLGKFIARLELRAGSSRTLARRVGISPATLWEYRRGNFPLPLELLKRLCKAVDEEPAAGEELWLQEERARLQARGYPEALAEFWALCAREGCSDKDLARLGAGTAAVRRLRYLELPPWTLVAKAAGQLCRDAGELKNLQELWLRDDKEQRKHESNAFGARLKKLRERQGVSRRELADLFGIGGKKPARIIKHIEEDGFYSAQAYPAGLAAVLTADEAERARLLEVWRGRRQRFHRRRRPETRTDLRLARELYGFELKQMHDILGYSSREYQRIERGVEALMESARERILEALHDAGRSRVVALLEDRQKRRVEESAWQLPPSLRDMITLLARREGGLVPLRRHLKRAGMRGISADRLRAIARGQALPAWPDVERVALACGVADLGKVWQDWRERYRAMTAKSCGSPLGAELRLLIAETASTVRAFSGRMGVNYSVLVRGLLCLDRDDPVKWKHVERILRAAGLSEGDERWREIRSLWYTIEERKKRTPRADGSGKAQANREHS